MPVTPTSLADHLLVALPSLLGVIAAAAGAGGVLIGTGIVVGSTLVLLRGVRLD